MGLKIKILGPWDITANGQVVKVAGERRVGLLARLALNAGQPVPAEQLLADVWGQSTAATAAKQLHIVVSRVRDLLSRHQDGEIITTVGGGYRLNVAREDVDAHLFTMRVRRAGVARARGEVATADRLLQSALGLWRGSSLAGLTAPWAQVESARLEEERLTAMEDHFDLRLAAGDHHAMVPAITAHTVSHPLRERPRAQLMLALYRASRLSDALAAYQETRRVMVRDLGIEPGPGLRRLQEAVLRRDPGLDLVSPVLPRTLTERVIAAAGPVRR